MKIIIKNTKYADSRTADGDNTRDKLYDATIHHVNDVKRGMDYFVELIHEAGEKHDYTKLDCFDKVYAPLVLSKKKNSEFESQEWFQRHITEERHHVNHNAHADVNLIDILEHITDVVMSGNGRAGHITSQYCDISPDLLYRAYWNTVRMLDDVVEVAKE